MIAQIEGEAQIAIAEIEAQVYTGPLSDFNARLADIQMSLGVRKIGYGAAARIGCKLLEMAIELILNVPGGD
jgi:hypothetical protein